MGASFIGLLPHVIESLSPRLVLLSTLGGLIAFFIIEKVLRIPHYHAHRGSHHSGDDHKNEARPAAIMILIGDALHNFVDGILIATAFSTSVSLGVVTSFAVVAHEIPQELGDFVVLLEGGMSPKKAYGLYFLSVLTTLIGALMAYQLHSSFANYVPFILAIAASSFLHIATVDLTPILPINLPARPLSK